MENHKLEIDSLNISYGSKSILEGVYLKIETGKITGLFGRNGTGKSSIMNYIVGFLKVNQGQLRLNDKLICFIRLFPLFD